MERLIENISKEAVGAIMLGILVIVFIIILSTFGETTGQTEITNKAITAILIIFGIGLPLGRLCLKSLP